MTDDLVVTARPTPHALRWLAGADEFLARHSLPVAIAIAVAALAVRVPAALSGYLNPDEILHVLISGDTTFADSLVRVARAQSPHPFLHVLVIYLLNLVRASDFVLRLPSVIAGALASWFGFLWMRRAAGPAAGLGTAALLAFLPETVRLSAQIREYALLLMFIAAALYLLEVGLDENRVWPILASGGLMLLALATLFAAIWVAPALAAYGLVRLLGTRAPRRLWLAWVAVQAAFAAGLAVAWFTQVSQLMGQKQSTATEGWLRTSYFQRGADHVLRYPLRQLAVVFRYLFSGPATGWVGLLAASAGVVSAVMRRKTALAVLLVLPFVANCAASFLGLYPFGGTRHVLHLVLFAAAAVGLLAAEPVFRRPLPVLAAFGLLLAAANIWPTWPSQFIHPSNQRRELMTAAVEYLEENAPPGGVVFCDHQSAVVLRYYLGRARTLDAGEERNGFVALAAGDYWTVRPPIGRVFWSFDAASFSREFSELVRSWDAGLDRPVWVFDAGWGYNLTPDLEWNYGVRLPEAQTFGRAISVFALSGRQLPRSAWASAALESLAVEVAPRWAGRVKAVLWPSDHDTCGPAAAAAGRLAPAIISYRELRRGTYAGEDSLAGRLPGLAFWVFGNIETHPELLRLMDSGEPLRAEGYRFTPLAVDPDEVAVVYLVEPDTAAAREP
ncbi:MAG: glycosyltransferase family 39 protein [bacterium]